MHGIAAAENWKALLGQLLGIRNKKIKTDKKYYIIQYV